MRWIVGSSLRFRYVVVALAAALMYFGTAEVRNQQVDLRGPKESIVLDNKFAIIQLGAAKGGFAQLPD